MVELDMHYRRVQKIFRVKGCGKCKPYRPSMTNYPGDIHISKTNKKS
jgi:hypothetical protein